MDRLTTATDCAPQSWRRVAANSAADQRSCRAEPARLANFRRVEEAFARSKIGYGEARSLASAATDTGYSDQSHMGREIKRITGLPPKQFSERMRTDEAFWIYRLINDHLQGGKADVEE
ncbi:helix-turn-helix domain-containing protein [Chania multitudinisentens]|uniref:helix-turn-helix domain-containing protein n=1 Tax=Chania multitudinisentens TaxID=1639108 RepID=UPI0012B64CF9